MFAKLFWLRHFGPNGRHDAGLLTSKARGLCSAFASPFLSSNAAPDGHRNDCHNGYDLPFTTIIANRFKPVVQSERNNDSR